MLDFLNLIQAHQTYLIRQDASSWEEAVSLSAQPLINKGLIDKSYLESVISETKTHGPYYIIAPHIAIPHSTRRDSINQDSLSFVTLNNPVFFPGDERPVSILLMLAIKTEEAHVSGILPQIVAIFESESIVNQLKEAKSIIEVFDIISSLDYRRYLS